MGLGCQLTKVVVTRDIAKVIKIKKSQSLSNLITEVITKGVEENVRSISQSLRSLNMHLSLVNDEGISTKSKAELKNES